DHLDQLVSKKNNQLANLKRDDIELDDKYLKNAKEQLSDLNILEEKLNDAIEKQKTAHDQLAKLEQKSITEVPEGKVDELSKLENQLKDYHKNISTLEKIVEEIEDLEKIELEFNKLSEEIAEQKEIISANTETVNKLSLRYEELKTEKATFIEQLNQNKNQLRDISEKINLAKTDRDEINYQLKQIKDEHKLKIDFIRESATQVSQPLIIDQEIPAGREYKKPLLALGIIVTLLAIILGALVEPLLFLLLIPAVILLFLSIDKKPAQTIKRTITDQERIKHNEDILQREKEERKNFKQAYSKKQDSQVKKQEILAGLIIQQEDVEKEKIKIENQISELNKKMGKIDEEYDELKTKLAANKATCQADERQKQNKVDSMKLKLNYISKLINDGSTKTEKDIKEEFDTVTELNTYRQQLQEAYKELAQVKEKLQKNLVEFDSNSIEDLYKLNTAWISHKQTVDHHKEIIKQSNETKSNLKNKLIENEKQFLEYVSIFKTAESKEQAIDLLEELEGILKNIENANSEIRGYRKSLAEKGNLSNKELQDQLQILREKIKTQANFLVQVGSIDNDLEEDLLEQFTIQDTEQLKSDIKQNNIETSELGSEIASREATVREKYRKKRNVSQIANEIEQVDALIAMQENDFNILGLASEVLEEAFEEMQRNFGPMVNEKTALIFSKLTNGKYENLTVARDFAITIENSDDRSLREWEYLSSGTIEQVYLALRLAITELVTDDKSPLPLLLDN
ncbi:MAG TPA: hypothetical protein VFD28_03965, partial [Candidatus Eisenbacteria bacterium]|nr:hypothetical protein [Candidatus Eisenbacteria bacterium]